MVLLPAVMMGRFQHRYALYNAERGPMTVKDLAGRADASRAVDEFGRTCGSSNRHPVDAVEIDSL